MGLFTRKKTFSDYEQKLLSSIEGMCSLEDTVVMVDHENMDCYIINENRHYKLIINSSGLIIENTVDFNEESFKDSFLDKCKEFALKRDKKNRLKIKESIMARKQAMADRMLDAFIINNKEQ